MTTSMVTADDYAVLRASCSKRILSFDVGSRHLAFAAVLLLQNGEYLIEEWKVIDLIAGVNLPDGSPLPGLQPSLGGEYEIFHREWDEVLIENQAASRRVHQQMEAVIYAYFQVNSDALCRIVDAREKFASFAVAIPRTNKREGRTASQAYHARKILSVECARSFLASVVHDGDAWAQHMDQFRVSEKDDLADSLLQVTIGPCKAKKERLAGRRKGRR